MAKSTNVGTIWGGIELDNKGFRVALDQSRSAMAKAALDMQKSSRIKIDPTEWKKLSNQLNAIKGRAQETRQKLLKATPGSDEAKKLERELSGLTKRLRLLQSTTEPARKELERMARSEREAAKEASRLQSNRASLAGMAGALPGTTGSILGTAIAKPEIGAIMAAGAAMTALSGGMATLGVASVKVAADIEMSTAAFTGLLRSADSAKQMIADLQLFASKTPFELPGLIDSTKMLMAYGFEAKKILPTLRVVGDAAAYLGGGQETFERIIRALGQIRNKGKATSEEMSRQLGEVGIPAWEMLAEAIGVSVPEAMKMVEKGQVDSATAINAILSGMATQFSGGMERLSKTFLGKWSTIRDSFRYILKEIGTPIIDWLKPKMEEFLKWFDKEWPVVLENVKTKWSEWAPTLKRALDAAVDFWNALKPLISLFRQFKSAKTLAGIEAIVWYFEKSAAYADKIRAAMEAIIKAAPILWKLGPKATFGDTTSKKPASKKDEKDQTLPGSGDFLMAPSPLPPDTTGITEGIRLEEQLRREIALSGQTSEEAALAYDLYSGALQSVPDAQKELLLGLAREKDAREAVRKATEEQAKTAEQMAEHQAKNLENQLASMRDWAGKMAETMQKEADSVISILKDQFQREQDVQNKANADKKSAYEKLRNLGRAGFVAMSGVSMFGKKENKRELQAGDITASRIRAAQEEYAKVRANETAMTSKITGTLFGNAISQYESASKVGMPDTFGKSIQQQVNELVTLVTLTRNMLSAIQSLNKPAMRTS